VAEEDKPIQPAIVAGLIVATCLAVAHHLWFWSWTIEDAAISYAFAQNIAAGHGPVPFPGGEFVEGYSNPTWVALLALLALVKIPPESAAAALQLVLGAAAVPLAFLLAQELTRWQRPALALFAAFVVATNSQLAHWGSSGLENALFVALLTSGLWLLARELRGASGVRSALPFLLLAGTRPEGVAYAAVAIAIRLLLRTEKRSSFLWFAALGLPFAGYQAARFAAFGWEFPTTYYAKRMTTGGQALDWSAEGWRYLRNWGHVCWHTYLSPVYLAAMVPLAASGLRRGLALAGIALAAVVAVDTQTAVLGGPVLPLLIVGLAVALPLTRPQDERTPVLLLCWTTCATGLSFAVWAGGDWMSNWRWMSLISIPLAVCFAAGADGFAQEASARLGKRAGIGTMVVLLILVALPNLWRSSVARLDTTPRSVSNRVRYMQSVAERLHIRDQVVSLDIDQGAHLLWSGFQMMDLAGLIDVPFAQHKFQPEFMREYVFEERRPHFVHLHNKWEQRSKLKNLPEWHRDYVEIPGYRVGAGAFHIGNHIRRDLIFSQDWPYRYGRRFQTDNGVTLEGWVIPSPMVGTGRNLYLEAAFSTSASAISTRDFRVVAFLADAHGVAVSWDLAPGYDWVTPDHWAQDEIFHGRWTLPIPEGTKRAQYDLGFVVFDAAGAVIPLRHNRASTGPMPILPPEEAHFAVGEVAFPAAVTVAELAKRAAAAKRDRDRAHTATDKSDCKRAEAAWFQATKHRAGEKAWEAEHRPSIAAKIAHCWGRLAAEDKKRAVRHLARARRWDASSPILQEVGGPLADRLYSRGKAAWQRDSCEPAYRMMNQVLEIDPTRAWARRYAEKARACRLKLRPR
jgi:hypothetical protein